MLAASSRKACFSRGCVLSRPVAVCRPVRALSTRPLLSISPRGLPAPAGLYDPDLEKDACGVGFVASIQGWPSHQIVEDADSILGNLTHRGAVGSDPNTGDGAGVMLAVPHEFCAQVVKQELGVDLPPAGKYATGIVFLSRDATCREASVKAFESVAAEVGLEVIGWRRVPQDNTSIGDIAKSREPIMQQVFVTFPRGQQRPQHTEELLQRRAYLLSRRLTALLNPDWQFYICSLSTRTIVYKGQLTPTQVFQYFPDLSHRLFKSHFALVHGRFSTNTFPTWERAQPLRILAHNGEINTVRGNANWMRAREGSMASPHFPPLELERIYPVIQPGGSDSMALDNALEFLVRTSDRTLPEAMMMLVPEAWENTPAMAPLRRAFYEYSSFLMEPWDGPGNFAFADGRLIGGVLDRNGLRPSRFYITSDDRVISASEVGVLPVPDRLIQLKGRLQPGKMFLVDTAERKIVADEALKEAVSTRRPYSQWVAGQHVSLATVLDRHLQRTAAPVFPYEHAPHEVAMPDPDALLPTLPLDKRLALFGYTDEHVSMLLAPMFESGKEPLGSMGNDTPLACLSDLPRLVPEYFKQHFAQVTNPPIDPIREAVVMSLRAAVGPLGNLLQPGPSAARRLVLEQPILTAYELEAIKAVHHSFPEWKTRVIDITFNRSDDTRGFKQAVDAACLEATLAIDQGFQFLVLSDRAASLDRCPVSATIAVGAVHQHLVRTKKRGHVALLVESGECREVHHHCVLLGYGADAICPYLVFEIAGNMASDHSLNGLGAGAAVKNYIKAVQAGVLKVMAKMGISTLQGYKGAQIFEVLGFSPDVVDKCFTGTPSRLSGLSMDALAQEALARHDLIYGPASKVASHTLSHSLPHYGDYHWRDGGERHINEPSAIGLLQDAVRRQNARSYAAYVEAQNAAVRDCTIRGLLDFDYNKATPVPIESVESAACIVKRFATGAMSYGSISLEAHKALAAAMNRLGGKSNTGEGGEDPSRYSRSGGGPVSFRSAIKQVASGRFGVTISYLSNADEIQIKMAQGAKPGEGGELPGHKVSASIAKTRHSTVGVGLISPPPHHDIYSIEDLAQLILDLKAANPSARISVKLVAEAGVGVVAAGVAKAHAEHILISGHDGGTGAASWTGVKHAGLPWELGLAETHQTLVMNDLRGRVVLQTDGQLRTGKDVLVAALLGAEEFGFSTAPLIALGCTMMRKCHLNTCPVGIATQDPELRKKFAGTPEHVVNFFFMLAEEIRGYMARLGIREFSELIGRSDLLRVDKTGRSPKVQSLDLGPLLVPAFAIRPGVPTRHTPGFEHSIESECRIDLAVLARAKQTIESEGKVPTEVEHAITNVDRVTGTTISHHVTKALGDRTLPDDSITLRLTGTAGQSLGAFLARGVTIVLTGDANDYVGKGLSGGTIVVKPGKYDPARFDPHSSIIVGNTCLYGATSGKMFVAGVAAERFAVRNSGALAVCEGLGDHGCEYMTGGRVVVLGPTGRNFGAGMSGGIAYVLDPEETFAARCNLELVEVERLGKADADKQEALWLRGVIQKHLALTGSARARDLLDSWPQCLEHFARVLPTDYKKVLEQQAAQQTAEAAPAAFPSTPITPHSQQHPLSPPTRRVVETRAFSTLNSPPSRSFSSGRLSAPSPSPTPSAPPSAAAPSARPAAPKLDKLHGFMKYPAAKPKQRPAGERVSDWADIAVPQPREEVARQAARCMDCGVPFCQSGSTSAGCPIGNVIPRWNDLVQRGRWREAYHQLALTNNFPEFTGRVCPAPCEGACVLGINADPVAIKSVEAAIIDHAFAQGWVQPEPPAASARTNRRVAIVGSGPAGMAAADQLNRAGHSVTVFEREDRVGGLLMYGIPNMKLDKALVQRRVDLLAEEGVRFQTGCGVGEGEQVDPRQLIADYDAVLLAVGSTWPRDIDVPGRQAQGVHFAMDYLTPATKQLLHPPPAASFLHAPRLGSLSSTVSGPSVPIDAAGKHVVIIGGGDTGVDCLSTAIRQGARSVVQFQKNPPPPAARADSNPWPAWPQVLRTEYGHAEAQAKYGSDPRHFNIATKELLTNPSGEVCAVRTVQLEWARDAEGVMRSHEVPNSERVFPADLVLLAIGYTGPHQQLIAALNADKDKRNNVRADPVNFATSVPKLFAAGDCRRGQSLVVWAIREGRLAARAIDQSLSLGRSALPSAGGIVIPRYSGPQAPPTVKPLAMM